jgi:ubiquinone/menaquinone biosynthesis C-methylase UbiE
MPVKDFGRVADIYDATRSLPQREMGLLVSEIRAQVDGSGPMADLGVGTGRFALPLQQLGVEVIGVDLSRPMVSMAVRKGVRGLVYADVRRVPFRDGAVDSALLVHILHLVEEWPRVVAESARVARRHVMTVLEGSEGISLRDEYREAAERMGQRFPSFEMASLTAWVAPTIRARVAESERDESADDQILHLEQRGQSMTWDVPDEVHRRIIEELRAAHGGSQLRTTLTIDLLVWSAQDLRDAALESQKG